MKQNIFYKLVIICLIIALGYSAYLRQVDSQDYYDMYKSLEVDCGVDEDDGVDWSSLYLCDDCGVIDWGPYVWSTYMECDDEGNCKDLSNETNQSDNLSKDIFGYTIIVNWSERGCGNFICEDNQTNREDNK